MARVLIKLSKSNSSDLSILAVLQTEYERLWNGPEKSLSQCEVITNKKEEILIFERMFAKDNGQIHSSRTNLWTEWIEWTDKREKSIIKQNKREALKSRGKQCTIHKPKSKYEDIEETNKTHKYQTETGLTYGEFIEHYKIVESSKTIEEKQLVPGDLIDLAGYRGQCTYVYHVDRRLYRSSGEYGYFLPSLAFQYILEHGLQFYKDSPAEFILLPPNLAIVEVHRQTGERKSMEYTPNINAIFPTNEDPDLTHGLEINGKLFNITLNDASYYD